ncbi:hypothetical protein D3C78_1312110 [compost metagenome]
MHNRFHTDRTQTESEAKQYAPQNQQIAQLPQNHAQHRASNDLILRRQQNRRDHRRRHDQLRNGSDNRPPNRIEHAIADDDRTRASQQRHGNPEEP